MDWKMYTKCHLCLAPCLVVKDTIVADIYWVIYHDHDAVSNQIKLVISDRNIEAHNPASSQFDKPPTDFGSL